MNFKQLKIYPYRNTRLNKLGEVGEIIAPNLAEVALSLLRNKRVKHIVLVINAHPPAK
jgi:hypothetical protein